MKQNDQQLRIEGIYRQNDRGEFMQRVKLAGGILSVAQARALADLGQRFGSRVLHLSTRGSIEFHNLQVGDLPEVYQGLTAVGLFSRGACGGAVRGISCSSSFGPGFRRTQVMLRHFVQHFSGNPHFEGLPKKFKIAFEAGYVGSRHLIQDLALVLVEDDGQDSLYDVWIAGGLGREPQAGFLYEKRVSEAELLPLAESIIDVYKVRGDKGRRLKHLLNTVGEGELRRLIAQRRQHKELVRFNDAFPKEVLPDGRSQRIALNIFAGELPALKLARIVALAAEFNCHWLLVTPEQNIELLLDTSPALLEQALVQDGFDIASNGGALRICPGNHDCRMGLYATRELARRIKVKFGAQISGRTLALSGCNNSCAQPQLAEFGILACQLKREGDMRIPLFDLYHHRETGLAPKVMAGLPEEELFEQLGILLQQ